jgi:hypothetical protein
MQGVVFILIVKVNMLRDDLSFKRARQDRQDNKSVGTPGPAENVLIWNVIRMYAATNVLFWHVSRIATYP